MSGFLPLSHTTVFHWRRNMRIRVEPHEIAALLLLDRARLYVTDDDEETKVDG